MTLVECKNFLREAYECSQSKCDCPNCRPQLFWHDVGAQIRAHLDAPWVEAMKDMQAELKLDPRDIQWIEELIQTMKQFTSLK